MHSYLLGLMPFQVQALLTSFLLQVKTMQAKIYTQELLDPSKILEESLPEPPVVPRVNQLPGTYI